jgi:hypothetical protein
VAGVSVLLAALALAGCADEGGSATARRTPAGTFSSPPYVVNLYTARGLTTGANAIFARVTDEVTGAAVPDLLVTLAPESATGGPRSCPVTGPMRYDAAESTYGTTAVFQSPGQWNAAVRISRPGLPDVEGMVYGWFVQESGATRTFTTEGGATAYVLSLNFPSGVAVGTSRNVVTLHASVDGGASWLPADDAAFRLRAWKPSSGEESTPGTPPALISDGLYVGTVDFRSSGSWLVEVTVDRAGATLDTAPPQPFAFPCDP